MSNKQTAPRAKAASHVPEAFCDPDPPRIDFDKIGSLPNRGLRELDEIDGGLELLELVAALPHDPHGMCRQVRFVARNLRRLVWYGALRQALKEAAQELTPPT